MATYTLTGSFKVTMGGRDITNGGPLRFGYLGSVLLYSSLPTVTEAYADVVPPSVALYEFGEPPNQLPSNSPWSTNAFAATTVALGDTSDTDENQGYKAIALAGGVPASTSFSQLCGVGANRLFRWALSYYPGQDLLPTWGSSWGGISILQGNNFYPDPIFAVFTGNIGDITNPTTAPPGGIPVNGLILLTGQATTNQNGIWTVSGSVGAYSWTRPDAWGSFLAAWSNVNGPNSIAEIYTYVSGSSEPYTVNGLALYVLETSDGYTWSAAPSAKLSYSNGDKIIGNDGQCYVATGVFDPSFPRFHIDPTFAGKVQPTGATFPWTTSTYQVGADRQVDVGNFPLTITPQLACTVFSRTYNPSGGPLGQGGYQIAALTRGYSVDVYSVHADDTAGVHIGTFASLPPNNRGIINNQAPFPPLSGYTTFDWLLGGNGTQAYYDGNPVTFTIPAGVTVGIGTIQVMPAPSRAEFANILVPFGPFAAGTSASAVESAISAALNSPAGIAAFGGGSCHVHGSGGWVVHLFGAAGLNLASIGCEHLYLFLSGNVTSATPLYGTSLAWYGNIYQFDPTYGASLKVRSISGAYTLPTLPAKATLAQVRAALVGAVSTGVISSYEVVQSGVLLTITIRSSVDPSPVMSSIAGVGLNLRSPWRVIVNYPDGSQLDSYAPVGSARVSAVIPWNSVGSDAVRTVSLGTRPGTTATAQYWLQIQINDGNPNPGTPAISASATSVAPDLFQRPVIAIDTGTGTEIAVTHDAGETWVTNLGPSGSMPSLVIDRRSNAYILATNSAGGTVTIRRNPNADWSSTAGMTTIATITNAHAAAIFGEPDNERHLLLTSVDGSGNLKLRESFDGGSTWTVRSTVTSGMATNRGFAAYARWIGGSVHLVYSKGSSVFAQRSVDGGTTWQAVVTIATGHTYTGVASVEEFGMLFVFAQDDTGSAAPWHLYRSGDLGTTWTEITNESTPQPAAGSFPAFGVWPFSAKLLISASNLG